MSDEENGNGAVESTKLVHIENAAKKIEEGLKQYQGGDISLEELSKLLHDSVPQPEDVGIERVSPTSKQTVLNTKPVPENPDVVTYIYRDEEEVPKMTVRFPRKSDNYVCDEEEETEGLEAFGYDFLKLIINEHYAVVQNAVLKAHFASLVERAGENGTEEGPDERLDEKENEFLSGIDPETAKKIKKNLQ